MKSGHSAHRLRRLIPLTALFFASCIVLLIWYQSKTAVQPSVVPTEKLQATTKVQVVPLKYFATGVSTQQGWRAYQEDRFDIQNGVVVNDEVRKRLCGLGQLTFKRRGTIWAFTTAMVAIGLANFCVKT